MSQLASEIRSLADESSPIIGVYGFQQAWETAAFAPHAMLRQVRDPNQSPSPASTLLRIANSLLQGKQQGIFPVEENPESETRMNTGEFEMGRESAGK